MVALFWTLGAPAVGVGGRKVIKLDCDLHFDSGHWGQECLLGFPPYYLREVLFLMFMVLLPGPLFVTLSC